MQVSRFFLLVTLLGSMAASTQGQELSKTPLRLDITATKKRLEVERTETKSTKMSTEQWAYQVSLRNSSFADQSDLTVQYRIYMKDDNLDQESSAKLPLRKQEGSEKIGSLPNTKTHEFTTSSMKIEKSGAKGGWVYTDTAKQNAKDSLYGIWIRVLKDNEIVTEYQFPPTLKTKVKWE